MISTPAAPSASPAAPQAGARPSRPPLKICFCNYEYPPLGGGGGTASMFLARELVRLGHTVEMITTAWRGLPRDVREERYRVRRLPALRSNASRCRPHEMASYSALACMYLFARGGPRPDAFVSFHSIPSGMAAWPLSVLWGVPHVIMFCGGDVPGNVPEKTQRYHRWTLWLNRAIVRQSAAALANSNGLAALARHAFPGKTIGIVRNGVDPSVFSPRADNAPADAPKPSSRLRFLFVGRLCAEKALEVLLAALDLLRRERPSLDWEFVMVGDGPERSALDAQIRALNLGGRVRIEGWIDRPRIPDFYRSADVFLLPSRFEGMPNVVLEAMASGLPVVGTRISGTEELVIHDRTGLLVAPEEAAPLAAAIGELAADPARRLAMGRAAREEVLRAWTWESRARELETVLYDCASRRKRS